jgi:hypothetical protein
MPRYYFHVRRGRVTILDQEGVELIDDMEAAIEATRLAQQIKAREALTRTGGNAGAVVVEDEEGRLLEMPFGGAREIPFRTLQPSHRRQSPQRG